MPASFALSLWLSLAAAGQPAVAAAPPCQVLDPAWDSEEIVCDVDAAAHPGPWRLQVDFAGGHDDTLASMAPLLDGAPLACAEGSKLRLEGEDGDVSLHCDFRVTGRQVLRTRVTWSHARYVGFALGTP